MNALDCKLPNQLLNILAYWSLLNSEKDFKIISPDYLNEKFNRYIGREALLSVPNVRNATLEEYISKWNPKDLDLVKMSAYMFYHINEVYTFPKFINKYFDFGKINNSDDWRWGLHPRLVEEFKSIIEVVEPNALEQMYILTLNSI